MEVIQFASLERISNAQWSSSRSTLIQLVPQVRIHSAQWCQCARVGYRAEVHSESAEKEETSNFQVAPSLPVPENGHRDKSWRRWVAHSSLHEGYSLPRAIRRLPTEHGTATDWDDMEKIFCTPRDAQQASSWV